MRRCLRQRFSQHAFQCLEAGASNNPSASDLDALGEIIEWLPDFWLRAVASSAWHVGDGSSGECPSAFPLSPFRLLACPLTPSTSSTWFREVCEAEGLFRRNRPSRDLVRWLAATWPWAAVGEGEDLPFAFTPYGSSTPNDPLTTSAMMMYDSSASLPALCISSAESADGVPRRPSARRPSPCPILRR